MCCSIFASLIIWAILIEFQLQLPAYLALNFFTSLSNSCLYFSQYLSRKFLSTTAVMSRFPSPKRIFSLTISRCHGFNILFHTTTPISDALICTGSSWYHSNCCSTQALSNTSTPLLSKHLLWAKCYAKYIGFLQLGLTDTHGIVGKQINYY